MQQKTHDFLVRMQVPMATFGGDLMGEAIDFAIHEMRNNRFVTLTDIENFDFQCFFFVLCFTSSVFALTSPIHLTSSTTIKIATIRLNIVHTTFLIKAADFFASLPFLAQEPEEVPVMLVVGLAAAGTAICLKLVVAVSLCHALFNVRCQCRIKFRNALVYHVDAVGVEHSGQCDPLGRAFGWAPLDDAGNIIWRCLPPIDQSQGFLPVIVLPAKILQFVVPVSRNVVWVLF